MRIHLVFALAFTLVAGTAAADAGYKVVANPAVRAGQLSRAQLSAMFFKRSTTWDDGGKVEVVMLGDGAVRDRFCTDVLGKSSAAVRSYWTRLVFAGRETPPQEKNTDAEVLAFVRATAGAVGFVSEAAAADGVKVIGVAP